MYLLRQVNEEKGYREFGGRPSAQLPVRDVSANMQVTAKQIRYKGAYDKKNNNINIYIER